MLNSDLIHSNEPLIQRNNLSDVNTELFGEFKSAPKESSAFLQLNSKIDDIMCQLGLLRNEVKELKEQLNISKSSSPNLYSPTSCYNIPSYYNIPTYPGQPMPPYPYQQQRYSSHLNSFQANS